METLKIDAPSNGVQTGTTVCNEPPLTTQRPRPALSYTADDLAAGRLLSGAVEEMRTRLSEALSPK